MSRPLRSFSGALGLSAGVCITLLGGSTAQAAGQVQLPSCAATAASAVARQSWREGASPFGLAYGDWTPEDFTALASRVRHCGGDPAYVEYLATQHRHLIGEPEAARSARLGFEAELKAIPSGDPAAALEALDALSSRVQASSMDRGDKAGLEAGINNRRRGEMLRKEAQDRVQAEANAEPVLKALIAEVDATPATVAGRRRLAELSSANRYRLPELSFPQQNRYAGAIERRIAQIDRQLTLGKCAGHTARMGLPAPMADYEVVGQLGMRMGEVVCQSVVATGHGEFRQFGSVGAGVYTVRSGDTTLVFRLGRYVRESDAFFPPAAPVQRGTPAFRFEGVRVGGRTRPASWGFMINYLAQYAGAWTEFSRDLR